MVVIPRGIIRGQVCPRMSEACKSVGAELRVIAWSKLRGTTKARIQTSAFTRTIATARARARCGAGNGARCGARNGARSGGRNGARARARNGARARARNGARASVKVICRTGMPSNKGNISLEAKSPVAYLVGKTGSSAGLPSNTIRGGVREKASVSIGPGGLCR